jgi:hypothetical protein
MHSYERSGLISAEQFIVLAGRHWGQIVQAGGHGKTKGTYRAEQRPSLIFW